MERLLINYLPYVVREYDAFKGIMAGEQPEFELVWDAQEMAFSNQYIDTATEYALSRWETMLKIKPKSTDTLESRRISIKAKLNTIVPYTIRALVQKMSAIGNGAPFRVTIEPGTYLLEIITEWEQNGQVDALKDILEEMLPVNIAVDSKNEINCEPVHPLTVASGFGFTEIISVSDAGNEYFTLETVLAVPGGTTLAENINLHD